MMIVRRHLQNPMPVLLWIATTAIVSKHYHHVVVNGFLPHPAIARITKRNLPVAFVLQQDESRVVVASSDIPRTKLASTGKKTLGLLTFDLDDTLYPIAVVIDEANAAFAAAMKSFGYDEIQPSDIANAAREIRSNLPPEENLSISHTEVRRRAIRREMEKIILNRKLKETADDWATPVSDLSPIVVNFAKKWAKEAVSPSVVQAVLNAWEMERHHAAERHLYPEIVPVLKQIKREHPDVIIGAVTDGRANPMLMSFTLAPLFDFCLSWEDDQAGRKKFFQDLGSVDGNAQLKWIYDAAVEKYLDLSAAKNALAHDTGDGTSSSAATALNKVWIHVGDDLAYDVGGSAQSGAKTIWLELNEDKYQQTARQRFDDVTNSQNQPAWSTTSQSELEKRRVMNELAMEHVDKTIHFLSGLPEAINEIIAEESEGAEADMAMSAVGASSVSGELE